MMEFVLRFILLVLCTSGFKAQAPYEEAGVTEAVEVKSDVQLKFLQMKMQLTEQDKKILEQKAELCEVKMDILKLRQRKSDWAADPVTGKIEEDAKPKSHEVNENRDQGYPKQQQVYLPSTTFIRWGRTECPYNTSRVYKGFIGGSYYNSVGGAANYVCLPEDPTWNQNKLFESAKQGEMHGGEYEILPDATLDDHSALCVVCEASGYSMTLMVPGRDKCYPGWNEAYHGELASGHDSHDGPSEFICLDSYPEKGSEMHNDGKLLYTVHAKCGALACPPYEDNALLTCVVCLK